MATRSFINHVGRRSFTSYIYIKIHRKILRKKQIMRLTLVIMLFSLIYLVTGKSNVKKLTESMGQEVIEIGTPIKELPMGLEEEPSAEEDDEKASLMTTGDTSAPGTKKDAKKTTTVASVRTGVKEVETTDDDEARIEKELAEIYKDTADYKTDSSEEKEVAKESPATVELVTVDKEGTSEEDEDSDDTPIGRQRSNFRFQPDSTDRASVEKFRTSVDEISCNNRQKLSGTTVISENVSKDAFRTISNGIILITAMLTYVFICA